MKESRKFFVLLHPNNNNMIPVFRRESEYTTASTPASVLMINAQGIILSVLGHDYFQSSSTGNGSRHPRSGARH